MADRMTPEQRRRCMQHVHSKDTAPEMIVRRWLWKHGFRYRLHVRRLPGTPDIVLHRYHTVINVNGCFWHGHENCRLYRLPKSNSTFWQAKITRNRERDATNCEKLKKMGWYSITIWECDLQGEHRKSTLQHLGLELSKILLRLNAPQPYSAPESQPMPIAAEAEVAYGKKADKSTSQQVNEPIDKSTSQQVNKPTGQRANESMIRNLDNSKIRKHRNQAKNPPL